MKAIYLICVLTMFSCSAKYHYNKALKRGLEVIKTSDTVAGKATKWYMTIMITLIAVVTPPSRASSRGRVGGVEGNPFYSFCMR